MQNETDEESPLIKMQAETCSCYLFLNGDTVVLVDGSVSGPLFRNTDLLESGGTLLVRNIFVYLLALLVIDCITDIIILCFIVCGVSCFTFLIIGGAALVLVDGFVNLGAFGAVNIGNLIHC